MVADAEKYKAEDAAAQERIQARNELEGLAYNLRNTLGEKEVASRLSKDDKKALEAAVEDALKWLETSQEASKEEYIDRKKELESVSNPIMTKTLRCCWCSFRF